MKKILISIFIFIYIILMVTFTYASSVKTEIHTAGDQDKTVIKGTEIYLYIQIDPDDNSYLEGFQANLTYDQSKLSIIRTQSNLGPYEDIYDGTKIGIKHKDDYYGSGTAYTIIFKASETCEDGDTVITINNFNIDLKNKESSTIETLNEENKNVTITLKTDEQVLQQRNEMYSVLSSYENNTSNQEDSNINKVTTTNENKLPQTGVETISVIAIPTLSVFVVIFYIAYKKYRNI